jgi:hypothetical protein
MVESSGNARNRNLEHALALFKVRRMGRPVRAARNPGYELLASATNPHFVAQ